MNILLVEDNQGDVRLTYEAFDQADANASLTQVNDGAEALEYLKNDPTSLPDLILLDINLPKVNGKEFLGQLRGEDGTKHIPVLILTTSNAKEDIMDCYRLGANAFITKPLDFDLFIHMINRILEFWGGICNLPTQVPLTQSK